MCIRDSADGAVELPPEGVEPVFGHGEELAVAAAELRTAFDRVVTKGVPKACGFGCGGR